jgi:hypothetical protein
VTWLDAWINDTKTARVRKWRKRNTWLDFRMNTLSYANNIRFSPGGQTADRALTS